MSWLRRLTGVIFAIGVAIGAGILLLPLVAAVDPVTRSSGFALMQLAVAAIIDTAVEEGGDNSSVAELTGFMWMVVAAVCVAPLVTVALVGEAARVRSFAWYSGATGIGAASAPWVIRAALSLPRAVNYNSTELRFALVFFLTGVISGSVYWFLAGRGAGGARSV
jgi:amino acid permease